MRSLRTIVTAMLAAAWGAASALTAPNVVPIADKLATSGQPPASSLAVLSAEGFQAVIYLAPNTVQDAVPEEQDLLRQQGVEFVHIPIPFDAPSEAHLQAAFAALDRLSGKKTLVHCQVNFRASTVTFLYRVLRLHQDPALAWEAVTRVWVPQGPWRKLVTDQLTRHRIKFDPF